jgi:hypothetical protein
VGTWEDGDLHGWTRVDVLPPDGMQEVSGSSPLSSTGQKRSSNKSNSEYSRKVQQRRPGGPPHVCSDRYLPLARAAGRTADFSHRSGAFGRTTWANSRSTGICDTCHLVVTRLVRAVSRIVTVAVFAGGHRATCRQALAAATSNLPASSENVSPLRRQASIGKSCRSGLSLRQHDLSFLR